LNTWVNVDVLRFPRREVLVRIPHTVMHDLAGDYLAVWDRRDRLGLEARVRACLSELEPVPQDVTLHAVWFDVATRLVNVVLGHPSFDVVRDGFEIPALQVTQRKRPAQPFSVHAFLHDKPRSG